jgi:hypothetical protein
MFDFPSRGLLIATPTHDGKLDHGYVNSLVKTLKRDIGMPVDTYFLAYDSLIQSARNRVLEYALRNAYEYTLFIDSDISWDSRWVKKMIDYDKDVISGVYRTKREDVEEYAVNYHPDRLSMEDSGLAKVSGVGFGFIMLSKNALGYLWENSGSDPYYDYESHSIYKNIFEVKIIENELYSEDIIACKKLREGGFDVYIDPEMECIHTGYKKYSGDFKKRFNKNV